MSVRLAVVGATGAVGTLVLKLLDERNFPIGRLKLLASRSSVGKRIVFRGESLPVELLEPTAFREIQLAIASTPDQVAAEFVPWALEQGTVVVDESGYHRLRPDVPLVIPEVNPEAIEHHRGLVASPNCSTTQLVLALKPLHAAARVCRVIVATYQATSGAGVAGQAELLAGTRAALAQTAYQNQAFKHPIAFNLIPQIGSPQLGGYTSEELKMVDETRKILADDSIRISATCIRVPVENCHSEAIWVETERPLSAEQARELWEQSPGVKVVDDLGAGEYPMPQTCNGDDAVFIGRIRRDPSARNGLAFWCVSDNLRKGAATNAVQIAELLASRMQTK